MEKYLGPIRDVNMPNNKSSTLYMYIRTSAKIHVSRLVLGNFQKNFKNTGIKSVKNRKEWKMRCLIRVRVLIRCYQ